MVVSQYYKNAGEKVFCRGPLRDAEEYFDKFPKMIYGWTSSCHMHNDAAKFLRDYERYPLTIEDFRLMIGRSKISFEPNKSFDGVSFTLDSPFTFAIVINDDLLWHSRGFVLVHEVIHQFYRFGTIFDTFRDSSEKLVDSKALEFYNVNREEVDRLVNSLCLKPKQLEFMF